MTGIDLIAMTVPVMILLLGLYIVRQARRSRESELNYKLRKCQISLHDAEQALDNTVQFYKQEIRRLKSRLGESADEAPAGTGVNGAPGRPANGAGRGHVDHKFRAAKNAFARLYHPDRIAGNAQEERLRTELFKEFWDELERIERGKS